MPHGIPRKWWDWRDFPKARFVIITRRPDVAGLSVVQRRFTSDLMTHHFEWFEAIRLLSSIPDAHWVSYEALVADPQTQVDTLADWIGCPRRPLRTKVIDQNAKWGPVIEPNLLRPLRGLPDSEGPR